MLLIQKARFFYFLGDSSVKSFLSAVHILSFRCRVIWRMGETKLLATVGAEGLATIS